MTLPGGLEAVIARELLVDNVRYELWRKIVQSGEEIWTALRDSLRGNASDAVWSAGLSTLRLVDYHDNVLVIGAPNQIQLLRVQQRYLPFITEQAQQLVGSPVQVSLTVSDASNATNTVWITLGCRKIKIDPKELETIRPGTSPGRPW